MIDLDEIEKELRNDYFTNYLNIVSSLTGSENMVYCNFKDCINADKCKHVLTEEQENIRRWGDVPTFFYKDKPECYVKDPNKQY